MEKMTKMDNEMKKPLVSVVVITYNSAPYIIETLESIKQQTYNNIELVISDDCSADDTVKLCKEWLLGNSNRFINNRIVVANKNQGVSGNCNQGVKNSHGEWIKVIAGDDQILPNGIQNYVDFANDNACVNIIYGDLELFGANQEILDKLSNSYQALSEKYALSQKKQLLSYLIFPFIAGPGIFYKRELGEKVGWYDEKYPMCEEDPFYTRVLLSGERFYRVPKLCVRYRISNTSLSRSSKGYYMHSLDKLKFFEDVSRWELIRRFRISAVIEISANMYRIKAEFTKSKKDKIVAKLYSYANFKSLLMSLRRKK